MPRSFYQHLHVFVPGSFDEFAHGVELRKLSTVVGIVNRAGAQTVAQGDGYVVLSADVADVIEMGVEEALLVVHGAPRRDDAAAAAYHARETVERVVHVLQPYAAMDGEVIHSLLALLDERVAVHLP